MYQSASFQDCQHLIQITGAATCSLQHFWARHALYMSCTEQEPVQKWDSFSWLNQRYR